MRIIRSIGAGRGSAICLGAVAAMVLLLGSGPALGETTFYAAPTSQGVGDGSSPENAVGWRSTLLWNSVRSTVNNTDVTVQFVPGTYDDGAISISNLGNPDHNLTIQGDPGGGTIMSGSTETDINQMMVFNGLRNATVRNFNFTGPIQQYGLRIRAATAVLPRTSSSKTTASST